MARYSIHPADSGGHYHDIKLYKDRIYEARGGHGTNQRTTTTKETEGVTCIA